MSSENIVMTVANVPNLDILLLAVFWYKGCMYGALHQLKIKYSAQIISWSELQWTYRYLSIMWTTLVHWVLCSCAPILFVLQDNVTKFFWPWSSFRITHGGKFEEDLQTQHWKAWTVHKSRNYKLQCLSLLAFCFWYFSHALQLALSLILSSRETKPIRIVTCDTCGWSYIAVGSFSGIV